VSNVLKKWILFKLHKNLLNYDTGIGGYKKVVPLMSALDNFPPFWLQMSFMGSPLHPLW